MMTADLVPSLLCLDLPRIGQHDGQQVRRLWRRLWRWNDEQPHGQDGAGDDGRGQDKVLKREKLSEQELNWDAGQYVFQANAEDFSCFHK